MSVRYRLALAWAVCVGVAAGRIHHARQSFDDRPQVPPADRRLDGNGGHAQIDFGGQWVMGRMVATGRGRHLYDRRHLWEVVRESYPRGDTSPRVARDSFPQITFGPDQLRHDDDGLMYWFMGIDPPAWADAGRAVALAVNPNPWAALGGTAAAREHFSPHIAAAVGAKAVGGPLYPPVQALAMAPLAAVLPPRPAYAVVQWVGLSCVVLAGWGVRELSAGRVWVPVAVTAILIFPGCRATLELGQNAAVSLAVLVWGWVLAERGRPVAGGLVWGLLAFKPTWAVAFLLVPLVLRKWRFAAAMMLGGAAAAAATLPVVGLQAWFDWLAVGREAADLYAVNFNWVTLSRDLFGLPRRVLLDFSVPEPARGSVAAAAIGWALWAAVFAGTIALGRRPGAAGFVALGAYLCGYRFMYYDALLAAFGVALLAAAGHRSRAFVAFVLALFVVENWPVRDAYEWVLPNGRVFGFGVRYAWDTGVLLLLWAWAGWSLRHTRKPTQEMGGTATH